MLALAFSAVVLSHVLFLKSGHGLHYDEAWFANYSLRILEEPGFWPFQAMNAHTFAWSHYITAFFFKIFGVSLWVYRLSYAAMAVLGLGLFSLGLKRWYGSRVATWFLLFAGTCPLIVLSHRFSVEVTCFFSFILGLLFFIYARENLKQSNKWQVTLLSLLIFVGVTSHALFLGIPLALLGYRILRGEKLSATEKQTALWSILLILPFFAQMLWFSKWWLKAAGVVAMLLVLFVWVYKDFLLPKRLTLENKYICGFGGILAAVPIFNFLLFLESSWSFYYIMGFLNVPWFKGSYLILNALLLFLVWSCVRSKLTLWAIVTFCLGVLTVVQAPRNNLLPAVIWAMILSWGVTQIKNRIVFGAAVAVVLVGSVQLIYNFYIPGARYSNLRSDFRFGVLKDSSFDNAAHYPPLEFLLKKGCSFNEVVRVKDARLSFQFQVLEKLEQRVRSSNICEWKAKSLDLLPSGMRSSSLSKNVIFRSVAFDLVER